MRKWQPSGTENSLIEVQYSDQLILNHEKDGIEKNKIKFTSKTQIQFNLFTRA